jgi:hypothetical protein
MSLIIHATVIFWIKILTTSFTQCEDRFLQSHQDVPAHSAKKNCTFQYIYTATMAMFIWLIIRLIQLVFSAGTVFFSHKKSANSFFQPATHTEKLPANFEVCFFWLMYVSGLRFRYHAIWPALLYEELWSFRDLEVQLATWWQRMQTSHLISQLKFRDGNST